MDSIDRKGLRRSLLVALLLCVLAPVVSGQANDDPNSLQVVDLRLDEYGDLVSVQFDGLGRNTSELIDQGKSLLELRLYLGERDVSDQITWRSEAPDVGAFAEYIGTHETLNVEIRRSFRAGAQPGSIEHLVTFLQDDDFVRDDLRAQLALRPALLKHAPNDGSLGDFFYGYNRIFATPPNAGARFEAVRDELVASAAAIVARHIAVTMTPDTVSTEALTVFPESGAVLTIDVGATPSSHRQVLGLMKLSGSSLGNSVHRNFMYSDMWGPLRGLARLIEQVLQAMTSATGNAGLTVLLFAILLRGIMLPLGLWSIRKQRQFAAIQQQMKPKIEQINNTLEGAEKSEQILQTYKEFGISPFSGLKGSIGLFVQLPILISLFAVTTESALLRDAPLMWISDLSMPDSTLALPFTIPVLGSFVNLLPILLGIICATAALVQVRYSGTGNASSPRSGLILALAFVIFFYPCAAALVMYWIVVNVSQIFEGLYVTRSTLNPDQ